MHAHIYHARRVRGDSQDVGKQKDGGKKWTDKEVLSSDLFDATPTGGDVVVKEKMVKGKKGNT